MARKHTRIPYGAELVNGVPFIKMLTVPNKYGKPTWANGTDYYDALFKIEMRLNNTPIEARFIPPQKKVGT